MSVYEVKKLLFVFAITDYLLIVAYSIKCSEKYVSVAVKDI